MATQKDNQEKGKYERSYQLIFNKKFIEVKNKSTYPPSAQNPKGEVHEDIGFISYDKARKTFVLRQFHIEGFVNQYKIESISADGKTIPPNATAPKPIINIIKRTVTPVQTMCSVSVK